MRGPRRWRSAGSPRPAGVGTGPGCGWYLVAAGGLLLLAAHALGAPQAAEGASGLRGADDALFVLLGAATIAAIPLGVHAHQPSVRPPWWLALAGVVLFLLGGSARVAFGTLGDLGPARPLWPDLVTLPGYALFGAGIAGFVRARRAGRGPDVDAVLDAAVAALAAFALAWVFLIDPALVQGGVPLSTRLLLVCYPTVSVFLVALAARIAATSGPRPSPAHHLLLTAMSALLVGDVVYMLVDAQLVAVPRRFVDVPYALGYLAFSLCALHPSMRALTVPLRSDEATPTRARLVLVAVSLAVPTVVLLARPSSSLGDHVVLALVVGALTAAAVLRVLRALRAHAAAEARLAHQATHDRLTGLPNRALLDEHLERLLGDAVGPAPPVAVLFLDVDRFKLVNDTGGHRLGDELLVAIATRLSADLGPHDLLARIGGDEFVVVLGAAADEADALAAAERLRRGFERPFLIRNAEIFASVSVGVAFAVPGSDAETLVRDADTAMYQAKATGRDASALFDVSMRRRVAQRLGLEQELRNALSTGQLRVAYQPVVQLADHTVRGFEALVRWEHPRVGSVPPSAFVPVAEDTGLIREIGTWVIHEACGSLAAWRAALPEAAGLYVGVNISARQLRDPGLGRLVTGALAGHRLPSGSLCLELTESLLMEDPRGAAEVLQGVREAGVRLALDDFGTGYSSLAYLRRFPVDEVKIDRSFVESLGGVDSAGESLVRAIVAMAAALGVATVGEGVETGAEARRLTAIGVDRGQGYYYGRPVSPERVPDVVSASAARASALHPAAAGGP